MSTNHGRFPFGRPNSERPIRHAESGRAKALLVGVYPSAFHVTWWIPADVDDRSPTKRGHPYVASLAVDVEPTVFWDGKAPDSNVLLESWKAAVNFKSSWGAVRAGHNGPSGAGLLDDYLAPLHLDPKDVAMTDAVPWFFVKTGPGSQGDAIERLRTFNKRGGFGIDDGSLPERPSPKDLVALAEAEPRRTALRREVLDSGAEVVVTLGQEALDAIRRIGDTVAGVQSKLVPNEEYGREGTLILDGRELRLLPLVHPGLLRQSGSEETPTTTPRAASWKAAHGRWSKGHFPG